MSQKFSVFGDDPGTPTNYNPGPRSLTNTVNTARPSLWTCTGLELTANASK